MLYIHTVVERSVRLWDLTQHLSNDEVTMLSYVHCLYFHITHFFVKLKLP